MNTRKCIRTARTATARITLSGTPYYSNDLCYFAWDIRFFDTSTVFFNHLLFNKVGDTKEEAIKYCDEIKENFKQAGIEDGGEITVIHEGGYVSAIGCAENNQWIDVNDRFVRKTFEELNLFILQK